MLDFRKAFPAFAGLYALEDWDARVIYVGSTTNLRRRLSQHLKSLVNVLQVDPYEVRSVRFLRYKDNLAFHEDRLMQQLKTEGHPLNNRRLNVPMINVEPVKLVDFKVAEVWTTANEILFASSAYKRRRHLREELKKTGP